MTQAAIRSVPRNVGEEDLTKEQMATRIDEIVDALFSNSSGAVAPTSPTLGMSWLDISAAPYRLKLWDGTQWNTLGALDATTGRFNAYSTLNAGSARPTGAAAGTPWLKTSVTPWMLYVFDGTDDIPLFSVDASTNVAGAMALNSAARASEAEALAGTENTKAMTALRVAQALAAQASSADVIIVADQKPDGTAGGSSVANVWTTRVLNTVLFNSISGASLGSNAVTLPAGTYLVRGSSPIGVSGETNHSSRLRDVTNNVTLVNGSSEFADAGAVTRSEVSGSFVLAGSAAVALQYWADIARATNGLGNAVPNGEVEVYGQLEIRRVA